MKFKFKKSAGAISLLVAALMVILALIFTIISDSYGRAAVNNIEGFGNEYPISAYGMVITFCVLAIVFIVCAYLLDAMFSGRLFAIIADALILVSGALLVACFSVVVSSRGDLMGYIWFSDLEKGNNEAVSALNMAVTSWVFYVLSIVALAVSIGSSLCVKTTKEGAQGAA